MKKIAIIGTQGVPAQYGGFETLVENIIGKNCSENIQYTIFCSSKDYAERIESYKGSILKYIPLRANGIQSVFYDVFSLLNVVFGYDAIVVLGVSGCLFLPFFRMLYKNKLIINIDGLEHRRAKWGRFAKWFLCTSEAMAVRFADIIVSDNKGIQDYVAETYGKDSALIAYGGDHANCTLSLGEQKKVLNKYEIEIGNYCFTVCRIEPENNCHITLEAFASTNRKLLFIGNWEKSEYGKCLKMKYMLCSNIQILDPVYDINTLYVLRKNCKYYIHGHSAGGTNPSLVEAMSLGCSIIAYDVVYNRETTENKADYFTSTSDLLFFIQNEKNSENGGAMQRIADKRYTWMIIAKQYEALY